MQTLLILEAAFHRQASLHTDPQQGHSFMQMIRCFYPSFRPSEFLYLDLLRLGTVSQPVQGPVFSFGAASFRVGTERATPPSFPSHPQSFVQSPSLHISAPRHIRCLVG